jgi:hypothetical protein
MKRYFLILACVSIASPAHAGFFERLHNNIDEGIRELCVRKPDLCKKLEAGKKLNAEATPRIQSRRIRSINVVTTTTSLALTSRDSMPVFFYRRPMPRAKSSLADRPLI